MAKPKTGKGFSIYLQADAMRKLQERSLNGEPVGFLANREVNRLYAMYADALQEIRLTECEATFLVDILNSSIMDEVSCRMFWASVEDACRLDHTHEKYNLDAKEIVDKVRGFNILQLMAIVDAGDRFWSLEDDVRNEDMVGNVKRLFAIK